MKKNILIWGALLLSMSLTSCLNDDPVDNLEYGIRIQDLETQKILEFAGMSHKKTVAVLPEGATSTVKLGTLNLAAKDVAREDIPVKFKVSHDGIDGNKFPLGSIQVQDVVIKKGERKADIMATITNAALTAAGASVSLAIEGVPAGYVISGNFGTYRYNIKIRSSFEGKYVYNCLTLGPWPQYMQYVDNGSTITLATESPNEVWCAPFTGLFNDITKAIYEFEPGTNKIVKVKIPEIPNWKLEVENSTYDASTKTTYVKWTINGKKVIEETFKRVK